MFNVKAEPAKISGVQKITSGRFEDFRGYFTETFRLSDIKKLPGLEDFAVVQANESRSLPNTIRGLHLQWDPPMGKLVRVLEGEIFDIVLDARKPSPTFGKAEIFKLTVDKKSLEQSWLWLPAGIAHGFFCFSECVIEYFCTGEYNSAGEASISPFAPDIDWSWAKPELVEKFKQLCRADPLVTDKDRRGFTVKGWFENK
ncbi:MAG: dTDP-4-dehydrorhamnose 3,5-epimerase family protein [bacterium]